MREWSPTEGRPARRPTIIVYQVHGAVAWLVGGYLFAATHALVGRALTARWLGGVLWGLSFSLGGLDASPLAAPVGPGRTALIALAGLLSTLLLALAASAAARAMAPFLGRLWLTTVACSAALGAAVPFLADSLAPVPGGDARPLAAGLGALWRPLGHAWLLAPFALVLILALIAGVGQGLVHLAAHLRSPGSDGFGSWALAVIGPGIILRWMWLAWAGWHLTQQRTGLWTLAMLWLLVLSAISVVAYNWSRRMGHHPQPPAADASGIALSLSAGALALILLLTTFGFSPTVGNVRLLTEPPLSALRGVGTVAGNLTLAMDKSGRILFSVDLTLLPAGDPLSALLATRVARDGASPAYWQSSAEDLLRLAMPGSAWQDLKAVRPLGAMLVAGAPSSAARRFTGTLTSPVASLTIALPTGGELRLDDLAIGTASPVTIIGLDAARQPASKVSLAPGGTFHYSRTPEGSYFLPGAESTSSRLAFFRIQTP